MIGMFRTELNMSDTKIVGWITKLPPYLVNTKDITNELKEKFKSKVPFQVKGRHIKNFSLKRISTLGLAIESLRAHADELE